MTYLDDLKGQVRGNRRLRNRIDRLIERIELMKSAIGRLVVLCDVLGHGDDQTVVAAARLIEWERLPKDHPNRGVC